MKKAVGIFSGAMAAVVLSACGNDNGDPANGEAEGSSGEAEISIDLGHGAAETNVRHEAAEMFRDTVEEETNGEIEINIFANEQLGSEPEMIENVSMNNLEIAMAGATIFTQYDSAMGAVELPYLFDSYEHAWGAIDEEIGDVITEPLLDDNINILAFFENGMRHMTNSSHPIETPEDMNGLSIRTPESDMSINTMNAMGGNATPMAFGELYLALQQGTVDGQENPLPNIHASSFDEVQDYVSLTAHQYGPLPMAISEEFFQSLSEEHQTVIEEAAAEAAQFHRESVRDNDEDLLQELEEAGMEANEPDTAPFEEAVQSVYDNFADEVDQELLDTVLEAAESRR